MYEGYCVINTVLVIEVVGDAAEWSAGAVAGGDFYGGDELDSFYSCVYVVFFGFYGEDIISYVAGDAGVGFLDFFFYVCEDLVGYGHGYSFRVIFMVWAMLLGWLRSCE